jgi:hypothetical protein
MTDFRDALRAELVAAAARPVPRRTLPPRPVLLRGAALALAAAAAAVAIFVLPWRAERAAQPTLQPTELPGRPLFGGSLEDGVRYRTRALHPAISFRAIGSHWFAYDASSPRGLLLQRREGDPAQGLEGPPVVFLGFLGMPTVVDPATDEILPAPRDLVGWLRANPDLGVERVVRTRVFGRPATQLDFHVPKHPARVDPNCPYAKVTVASEPPNVATCAAITPDLPLAAHSAGRLLVPDGADPLVVVQASLVPTPARIAQIVRESTPLLDSTLIGR